MKLHAALLSLLCLVGCSKNTEPLPPPDGTGTGTGPGTGNSNGGTVNPNGVDPAAGCFARCDEDHQKGLAKFDALDDCMEARCKQGYEDPSSPRKACGPIDQGKVTYSDGPTDKCMADMCCAEAEACANDPDCAQASSCYTRCTASR